MIDGDDLSSQMARMFIRALTPRTLLDVISLVGSLVKARLKGAPVPTSPANLFTATEKLNLVPLPASLLPNAEQLDSSYLFFGPNLMAGYAHDEQSPAPSLVGSGRCLYVSMGSTPLNNQPDLFAAVIAGFGGSDWNVIMNIGEADATTLGEVPSNIVVRNYLPQIDVLRDRAELFLTHGGMNSVLESCYFGVPMMVLALQPETRITARQVSAKGLGVELAPADRTGGRLREIADQVVADPTFVENLRIIQGELRRCGGARLAADALEAHSYPKVIFGR
jgi:MGT family glycosyltransferase